MIYFLVVILFILLVVVRSVFIGTMQEYKLREYIKNTELLEDNLLNKNNGKRKCR